MDDATIIRSLKRETTAEEDRQLVEWRAAAPEHEAQYQTAAKLWSLTVGALKREVNASAAPSGAQLLRRAPPAPLLAMRPGRRIPGLWWAAGLAALLLLAIGAAQWIRLSDRRSSFGPSEFVTGRSETSTVRLADGSVVRLAPESRLRIDSKEKDRDVWL